EAFLKEFQLGGESELHQYVSGGLTVRADFRTAMDEMLLQDAKTINGSGTFGMDRARVRNHPMQVKLAELIGAHELRDLSLDSWTAKFDIKDGLMTLTDMNLTSQGLGVLLNGTHNLVDDRIAYRIRLTLPPTWSARVEGLLTKDGVEALKTDAGLIAIPILVTGTSENPSVGLDRTAIAEAVAIYLRNRARDGAGRLLDGLIRRN